MKLKLKICTEFSRSAVGSGSDFEDSKPELQD